MISSFCARNAIFIEITKTGTPVVDRGPVPGSAAEQAASNDECGKTRTNEAFSAKIAG